MKLIENLFEKIDIGSIPEENKHGDCFLLAYRYVSRHPNAILVHGIVTGRGNIEGIEYNHAWAEDNGLVIDNTMNLLCDLKIYYMLGQVKITYKYTLTEMYKKASQYGTYGPWEDELWQYP